MNEVIGIAVAGLDVNVPRWQEIVWGEPQNGILGRAARAIKLAVELNAEVLILSTGATKKDGLSEAEFTRRFALEHLEELFVRSSDEYDKALMFLTIDDRCILDEDSQDTRELIGWAMAQCDQLGCEQLWFVTDKTNLPRLTRDVLLVAQSNSATLRFTAADTDYGTPAIAEPPINRKDEGAPDMAAMLNAFFRLNPDTRNSVAEALLKQIMLAEVSDCEIDCSCGTRCMHLHGDSS